MLDGIAWSVGHAECGGAAGIAGGAARGISRDQGELRSDPRIRQRLTYAAVLSPERVTLIKLAAPSLTALVDDLVGQARTCSTAPSGTISRTRPRSRSMAFTDRHRRRQRGRSRHTPERYALIIPRLFPSRRGGRTPRAAGRSGADCRRRRGAGGDLLAGDARLLADPYASVPRRQLDLIGRCLRPAVAQGVEATLFKRSGGQRTALPIRVPG